MNHPEYPKARRGSDFKSRGTIYQSTPPSPSPYTARLAKARGWILFLRRRLRYYLSWIVILLAALALESYYHTRPLLQPLAKPLDKPFYTTCQDPPVNAPRANATLLMLARNSDIDGAVSAVRSVEAKFNHWAHYPITFLNDETFDSTFKKALTAASSGAVTFATIPASMWSIPSFLDENAARKAIARQGATKMPYGGLESYHHMCRFNSGFFFDIPELAAYKWYWRIEPDIRFTCDITYDPFVEMQRAGKKYGYIIALWELKPTVPTLYRKFSDYKSRHKIPTTRLWQALINANPAPWPIRKIMSWSTHNSNSAGDTWNACHFWSNFEIADMDWYRTPGYRALFEHLDRAGGFYFERWGDAPVHTLAAALLLKDSEIHHFRDWGYSHPPFQYIPAVPRDGSSDLEHLENREVSEWMVGNELAGCRCEIDAWAGGVISPVCGNVVSRAFR